MPMQLVTVLVLCGCLAVGMGLGLLASLKLDAARRPEQLPYKVGTLLLAADHFVDQQLGGIDAARLLPDDHPRHH